MIVTVALLLARPSLAVNCNTYTPEVENDAEVLAAFGLANVTVPGPLIWLQVINSVPLGSPSSVALPRNDAAWGNVTT